MFPGGERALYTYLKQKIQYPQMEKEQGITGKVYVSFVVDLKMIAFSVFLPQNFFSRLKSAGPNAGPKPETAIFSLPNSDFFRTFAPAKRMKYAKFS